MSQQSSVKKDNDHTEQGAMRSYVTGFVLSLICTIIPYYLVTHKVINTSQRLLLAILAFAFVQVVIQVVFFLHLGRGPKPRWNLYFFVGTLGIVAMVVGGSILIIHNLHYNMSPGDATKKLVADEGIAQVGGTKTGACEEIHANHVIYIKDGNATPIHTDAHKCDTLSFVNQDSLARKMAFGVHPAHTAYAGVNEFPLTKQKNYTITLSETGSYEYHDHDHPDTFGTFTVSAQ